MTMTDGLEAFAQQGELVVFAGAGVSAGWPSALPGWKPLNQAILNALRLRLETALDRQGWLESRVAEVDAQRGMERFPPEYQAQIIEEMCGERYFHALQALDVSVINVAHDGIAALAEAGALKAIVTTNFDRLIERALDQRGVPYVVAYDDAGYQSLTAAPADGGLRLIKIHGCVSAPLSMIDTLKQRKLGRSRHLQTCLTPLHSAYWLYLGFSAADLEGDPDYLGLREGAAHSPGATYVAYPRNPELGKGAQLLMNAYAERGTVVVADSGALLADIGAALGIGLPPQIPADEALGLAEFQRNLTGWVERLSLAATGLCLGAVLESAGEGEAAVRVLDRLVRKELYNERETADFRALQLHYGRLGAAWGRFITVPDLNGAASNASVETVQSLLRVREDAQVGFVALGWLACVWLWLDQGQQATAIAVSLLVGLVEGQWSHAAPSSDEDAVDAWLAATQVCLVNLHQTTLSLAVDTAPTVLERARHCGDAVRAARVVALYLLALAETSENVPALVEQYRTEFDEAQRVGDGFALGLRALALGRWHVGAGGVALTQTSDPATVARQALTHLDEAARWFEKQGMDPWQLFLMVQRAKAYGDLRDWDSAQACIDAAVAGMGRFPVFASFVYEAIGQLRLMYGDPSAVDSFMAARQAAEDSGLRARAESLGRYFEQDISRG